MPTSKLLRKKTDVYATALLEYALAAGDDAQSLESLFRLSDCTAEVRACVFALCELGKYELVSKLAGAVAALAASRVPSEGNEASVAAQTLLSAAASEGHSPQRIVDDLRSLQCMTPEVLGTLGVMGTGSDQRLLVNLIDEYRDLLDVQGSMVPVRVTTAIPLDDALRDRISKRMEAELNKSVYLIECVKPSIIGGLIVEVGDETRDASVRAQLIKMRETLQNPSSGGEN